MTALAKDVATTDETETMPADEGVLVEDDVLVEEVSIDGMCGVY